ncbi:SDR family NAD(P)-dependent oxidoreductase [Sneathiella sp.]|jgi:NAD(P)-dependent dehydrogenase (short-subunit alcohol dehydrogenase family)|nr:SDR family NAD(P)-dependent oxidoreductase [Sneathiella sp.]MDF2366039.1 SDR family NAD(P)-dependent oxidoreductase [Sneathiella sp.]
MDLDGKTIVITGSARGLGRKMAEEITRHGANLALVDLDKDEFKVTEA